MLCTKCPSEAFQIYQQHDNILKAQYMHRADLTAEKGGNIDEDTDEKDGYDVPGKTGPSTTPPLAARLSQKQHLNQDKQ